MRNSEIFDEFVKVAYEKGLINNNPPSKKALAKDYDKEEASTIEALYGIKPNEKDKNDYEKNIMEVAHPGNAVVSTSYDKIDGLVENNIERQNILLHIVNKTPNGQYIQKKLATQRLLMSLIRVANDLDNKSEDALRVLADSCIEKTANDGLKKVAFVPILIGIGAVIAAVWIQQHFNVVNESFKTNHSKLEDELNDFLKSNSNWGVGHDYSQNLKNTIKEFIGKLDSFYKVYDASIPIIQKFQKPSTQKELTELALKPETTKVKEACDALKEAVSDMSPYLEKMKENFSSQEFKNMQTENKGALTSFVDSLSIFHGGHSLVADDFDDVIVAITAYQESIAKIQSIMESASTKESEVQNELADTPLATKKDEVKPSNKDKSDVKKENKEDDVDLQVEETLRYFQLK